MIFSDSRYASGVIYKAYDAGRDLTSLVVKRQFTTPTSTFFYHTWREGDRLDNLAAQFLDDPNLWWYILDFNPEVANSFSIPVGSVIRIPNG